MLIISQEEGWSSPQEKIAKECESMGRETKGRTRVPVARGYLKPYFSIDFWKRIQHVTLFPFLCCLPFSKSTRFIGNINARTCILKYTTR